MPNYIPMLNMISDISIYHKDKIVKVPFVNFIQVNKSVEKITQDCLIRIPQQFNDSESLPAVYSYWEKDQKESKAYFKGNEISVSFGYEGEGINEEFHGVIDSVTIKDGMIVLKCVDLFTYYYKATLASNKVYLKQPIKKIVLDLNSQVESLNKSKFKSFKILNVKIDENKLEGYVFDSFNISNSTCFEVLDKIRTLWGISIIPSKDNLAVDLFYQNLGEAKLYDFSRNIHETSLDWNEGDEAGVEVIITYKDKTGVKKTYKKKVGISPTRKMTYNLPYIRTEEQVKKMAESFASKSALEGFSGTFTGWLIPNTQINNKVKIKDDIYVGEYYISQTSTTFDRNGGKRTMTIGKTINPKIIDNG